MLMKHLLGSSAMTMVVLAMASPLAHAQEVGVAIQPPPEEDRQAVEGIRDQFMELYNDRDMEGLVQLFSEDVLFYDARGQSHEGRDAVREFYRGFWEEGFTQVDLETIETEVWRDNAYAIGRYTYENGEVEPLEGYYMVLFTRDGNDWRLNRVVANMTMPEEEDYAD
jgi:uncharacterized protein (TIGR02246 family)